MNPLPAGRHIATFLHQLSLSYLKFKGTMVLVVDGDRQAVFPGLLQKQGQLSAVPVRLEKAATIPKRAGRRV